MPDGYQQQRLHDVVAATRILSPSAFEYAGSRHDAGADAVTGQFGGIPNPVPILPLLANRLYASAYCTLPGSSAWEDAATTTAGGGTDMTKELSEANTGSDRRTTGWIVTYVDPNGAYAAVTRRGIHRYAPLADLAATDPGRPPAAGDVVRLVTHREVTNDQGFYMANGEAIEASIELKSPLRFYWNVDASGAAAVMRVVTATLNGNDIPFSMKMPRYAHAYARFDSTTLYLFRPWLDRALPHIASAYRAVAGQLGEDVPLFTKRLAPGLAFAEDPGGGDSFGTHRCRLLSEGLWAAYAGGATELDDVLAGIRRHFRRSGLRLEQAWANPWHLDRYTNVEVA